MKQLTGEDVGRAWREAQSLGSPSDEACFNLMAFYLNRMLAVPDAFLGQPVREPATNQPPPPVDRSQQILTDGSPVTPSHQEIKDNGQQKEYVVLTPEERAKGFVRPVRRTYVHVGKPPEGDTFEYPITTLFPSGCGTRTSMSQDIAETYARDPGFYGGTFCVTCRKHLPLNEFVWEGTTEQVGS